MLLLTNPDTVIGKNKHLVTLLFISAIVFLGCQGRGGDDEIVARVGNARLSQEEMRQKMVWGGMNPDRVGDFIERWVNRELLFQEAKRLRLDKSIELQWELEQVEKEYLIQKLLERTFAQKVQITEEEIELYYEKNKEEYRVLVDEVRALHILTKTRAVANVARQEIIAGKPFEEVAREHSVGIFRDRGGNMGFFRREDVIPEIGRIAFRTVAGNLTTVIQSSHGYHILKVLEKLREGDYKSLPHVRDEIKQHLRVNVERLVYNNLLIQLQKEAELHVSIPKTTSQAIDTLSVHSENKGVEE